MITVIKAHLPGFRLKIRYTKSDDSDVARNCFRLMQFLGEYWLIRTYTQTEAYPYFG